MIHTNITVSFWLDKRVAKQGNLYPVKLVVYHGGKKKRYSTAIDLTAEQWEKLQKTNLRDDSIKIIKRKLEVKKQKAEEFIQLMDEFTFLDFEKRYLQERVKKTTGISDLFLEKIEQLEKQERIGSASLFKTTLNSLLDFKPSLLIKDVTKKFLEDYEQYMLKATHRSSISKKFKQRELLKTSKKAISTTTIGIYLRNLRAIVNIAIEKGLLSADKYPFKGYDIPSSRNIKKSLDVKEIKALLNYSSDNPDIQKGIDFWLFSYISNGMNFTDICLLKPENDQGEFFYFFREKTKNTRKKDKRPIMVPVIERTRQIIEKYRNTNPDIPYLFNILPGNLTAKQRKYKIQGFIKEVNDRMKIIAEEVGITKKIGTYVARHSHSTILKRQGVSTEFIQGNLGHSSVTTTENYLDDFEDDVKLEYARKLIEL